MANYQNVETFFNTENLVDANQSQIIPIRFVQLESNSDGNPPPHTKMNKWFKDSANLIPSTLAEIDFSNGDFTTNVILSNGNYARIEIHPVYSDAHGLEDGGTIKTTLYKEDGTIIREGSTNPFPSSSNTGITWDAINRGFYIRGGKLVLANYHRAGKYGSPAIETKFGYNFGFAVIPLHPEFEPDLYYPINGSIDPLEMHEIPLTIDPIASCPQESELVTPNANVNLWETFIAGSTVEKGQTPHGGEDTKGAEDGTPEGGNNGDINIRCDNILPPDLPSEQVANIGLYGVWHLYAGDVRVLSNFLWSDDFFDNVIKNLSSPLENIVSFGIVPWTAFAEATQPFTIANVQVKSGGANYSAKRITQNFYMLDCGTVDIDEIYFSFADYEPYTKNWLYLPFIGIVDLPADDVQLGGKVKVQYRFDIVSGVCVANIITYTKAMGWNTVAEYTGNLLATYPLTGANYMTMYNQLAHSALGVMAGVLTENVPAILGSATNALTAKPSYSRSGGISNVAGLLSARKPYLIRAIPNFFEPNTMKHDKGFISNLSVNINDISGFVRGNANYIELRNISGATETELEEIKELIGGGIYV